MTVIRSTNWSTQGDYEAAITVLTWEPVFTFGFDLREFGQVPGPPTG
jgi:hypothetical protein